MTEYKTSEMSSRTGTEYKLSVSSNPGSRRSSLGGNNDSFSANHFSISNNNNENEAEQNVLQEYLVPQIRVLTDSMITLDSNFVRLNRMHDNLVDLNESFGSLIYGILCSSACTDFPGIPSNIEKELRAMKRVQSLKVEKENLQRELAMLKNPRLSSNQYNGEHVQKKQFSEPLFPASGNMRRHASTGRPNTYNNRSSRFNSNELYDSNENYNDDDNNSEESFVINPSVQLRSENHQTKSNTSDDLKKNSKLRRRSILHTIRNSLLSEEQGDGRSNMRQSTNYIQDTGRASLVGMPSRVTSRQQEPPRRKTVFSGDISNSADSRIHRVSKTRTVSRTQGTSSRPPFR